MSYETSHWAGGSWGQTQTLLPSRSRKENLLMKRVVCLVTFLALSVAVSHVHAQATGDPREGLTLARQVCSDCHAIREEGSLAKLRGAEIIRACNRSWITIAALRWRLQHHIGDADVQVSDRTKRRCYRLHPQPTLAKASLSVPLRQHRQVGGAAARAAADKRGVTRLRPHISRQSALCRLRPQVRKYRRNALSGVMGQSTKSLRDSPLRGGGPRGR